MDIIPFFDKDTATITYIIIDTETKKCAVIDPVLDYDQKSGHISTKSADKIIDYIAQHNLSNEYILETHIHADHLTAAAHLKQKIGGQVCIGDKITDILSYWVPIFNTHADTPLDASQFDILLKDGVSLKLGNSTIHIIHTAGHTPACISYRINDIIFVGDTLFMPKMGTSRADFPGGNAETLYNSIQKILSFPDNTRIFTGHDYPDDLDKPEWESSVSEQKAHNKLINETISKAEFIKKRQERDRTLNLPQLLLPAIQFNLRAGNLPTPEDNGTAYIKIPINKL